MLEQYFSGGKMMKTRTIAASGPSLEGSPWPPGNGGEPYYTLCLEVCRLLIDKREYYGCTPTNPLDNAQAASAWGLEPWKYQAIRIGEKIGRLKGLPNSPYGAVTIRDTLMDIAGHAIIALATLDAQGDKE